METIMEKSLGPDGQGFAERRADARQRVLKGAMLSFNKGYSAFECVVRNVSDKGAKLSLAETFSLPASFDVRIAGDETSRKAHVRWRTMTALGVEFD